MSPAERSKFKGKKKKRQNVKPIKKSRKEVRKEQRKQKKVARAVYFQNRKELRAKHKCEHDNTQPHKVSSKEYDEHKTIQPNNVCKDVELQKKRAKEKKQREAERQREKRRKKLLSEANSQEDKVIKKLEKQLKLNKRKNNTIPKSFVADGLDYLLDFCVGENRKHIVDAEKQLLGNETDTEFQKDLLMVTEEDVLEDQCMEKDSYNEENEEGMEKNNDTDSDSIDSSSEADFPNNNDSHASEETSEGETSEIDKSDRHLSNNNVNQPGDDDAMSDNQNLWEDIYGRRRDAQGNVLPTSTKYVPPAARAIISNTSSADQKLLALRKQLKGCLNRVAEHNMHSIATQIDDLYMKNSRNNMNDILSKLMMEALVAPVLTPDRLVCEHMMLIAILHANVGIEVGAQFLERLVKRFNEMLEIPQDVENKELDNVVLMIAHLYNFKIYGHQLLYQILNKLLSKFTEKEIELILLILKTVGFPLRKDDPIALKEYIQNVQQKASQTEVDNSRVRFMLDVLLAIKNNNMSKIPQYDPSHMEHLKKVVKSVIRKGNAITQFNVSLEDLLHADERGKWWVIGSAWSGSNDLVSQTKTKDGNKLIFGEKIMELARKQRMNTDTRRNIFCVLMTAEDYLDAFEKLHHLGLRDQQEREVIHVLIHCCLQEKKSNPYYAVLAQKLCEFNRKYHLTIQYTFWDKLKTLESYGAKQLNNLARFLTHLFVEKCLPLSILKVVEFAELDKHTMRLVRQIILGILLHKNEENCLQVFEKISVSPQLQSFRESLRLFINHFLIKNIVDNGASGEKETTLRRKAELVDKILASRSSRVVF